MSNVLIIKHGSLGDIAQASGAIQDIFDNHEADKVYLLTTKPYVDLFKRNPYLTDVILDKRLSRFNLIYLFILMRKLKKLNFSKVYDLQNSSRTNFYKKILFPQSNFNRWSSSETTLPKDRTKKDFDKNPVLDRFAHQLKNSGLKINHTMKPDFSWSCENISKLKIEFNLDKYILLFPFCSPHLTQKKWPFYNELISIIKDNFKNKFKIIIAPGPDEIYQAKQIKADCILHDDKPISISQLSSLIKESSFVVANDTGPAHMAAHLNTKGLSLFGSHTTAHKVSIERENFKAIQVEDLNNLSAEKVFNRVKEKI